MNNILLIVLLSIFYMAYCQTITFEAEVDDLVKAGMSARGIPAVSLAVVHHGAVVLSKGYGVKDVIKKTPADADTVFGLASCTKAFTTTVLAKLLRSSNWNISSKVSDILGQQAQFNNSLLSNYATLKDLMTHSMGVPRNNFIRLDNRLTRDNLMTRLQYLPSTKEFRDSFVYSDLMYGLLAHVTEVVGGPGKSWEDIITAELFQPLSMENSTFMTRVNFSWPDVAQPYSVNKNNVTSDINPDFLRQYSSLGGSGTIMSSANDMAKYLQFLVKGGKNQKGQQVVEPSVLEMTYTPIAALTSSSSLYPILRPTTPVTMSTDGYGLGWRTGYYRGYKMYQHSGSTFGYTSLITILPHSSSAIFTALSSNDDGYNFRAALHCAILDLLLGEKPWINSTTIATFPSPWVTSPRDKRDNKRDQRSINTILKDSRSKRHEFNLQNLQLTNFTGVFVHGAYGTANIFLGVSSDTLRMTYGIGLWELKYTGNGTIFDANWLGPAPSYNIRIRFLVNNDVFGFECLNCDTGYVPAFYRH